MFFKEIDDTTIVKEVKNLILKTNFDLTEDVTTTIKKTNSLNKTEDFYKNIILKNIEIAKKNEIPLCQDTGLSIFYVELGRVFIKSEKTLEELLNIAVAEAYATKKLRPSVSSDAIDGKNTKDNTPCFIHYEFNNSETLKIKYMAKGGGSENASIIKMFNPTDTWETIENFITNHINEKAKNACPPILVGIGLGGTFDTCASISKKALFRKIGERNKLENYAKKEIELKEKINKLGIGYFALKEGKTALDVFIEAAPRHIATMPVAISILCHSARRGEIIL